MRIRITLLIALASYASTLSAAPTDDPLERSNQIGSYLGSTRGAQQLTYLILDYCGNASLSKPEDIAHARDEWNRRNLVLVNSWREVLKNFFTADDIPPVDIPVLLEQVDLIALPVLKQLKFSQEGLINIIAAKPIDDQKKTCGLLVGLIIGGGRDIMVTSPAAMAIYKRFAPSSPAQAPEAPALATSSAPVR